MHPFLVWVNNIEQQKLHLLFLLNPIPFNGQDYEKQKGLQASEPVVLQVTKQVQKNSFISNVLPYQV